jgi:TniQ
MFASQALGGPCEDPDRDVKLTVLRRLAQRTGQTSAHLAGGLLQVSATATYDTPSSLAENVLLLEDTFLLARAGCDRLGRANAVLQYCPLCFQTDTRPYFRRAWRLAHIAVCLQHGCRLRDRCWQCDKQVAPLSQRTTGPSPRCSRCLAALCDAPPCPSSVRARQAALQQMLIFVATQVPPGDRRIHVTALRRHFRHDIGGWVADRERAVARLSPASAKQWFGEPVNGKHAVHLQMLVEGAVPKGRYPVATRARRRGGRMAAAQQASAEDEPIDTGRRRALPDYSDTARTAIWNIISGQRDLIEASARQGVQSADQNR